MDFIIIGVQRSGTTLLSNLLSQHSEVTIAKDTYFGRYASIYNAVITNDRNFDKLESFYAMLSDDDRLQFAKSDFRNVREALTAKMSNSRNEGSIIGDKSPDSVRDMFLVRSLFPNCKFLMVVRDPRAVVSSMAKRANFEVEVAANEWRLSMTKFDIDSRMIGTKDIFIINYENLILRTEQVMSEVCSFLEINFQKDMLNLDKQTSTSNSYVSDKIEISNLSKWKLDLTEKEIAIIDYFAFPIALNYGYEPMSIESNRVSEFRVLSKKIVQFSKALLRRERVVMKSQVLVKVHDGFKVRLRRFISNLARTIFSKEIISLFVGGKKF